MTIHYDLRRPGDTQNPPLAWPFGKQSTKGRRVLWAMEGARKKVILYLSSGGRYGCDGIDKLYYEGTEVSELDGGSSPQWVFHPGTRSTGYGDPVQGRPTFFPELDFTFSGRSYVEVLLPEEFSGDEADEPGEFEIYMRGLKVMAYSVNALGRLVEEGPVFSANNSYVGIYILREGGRLPLSRFHRWAQSWIDYRDVCDGVLSWDSGSDYYGVVDVPRYDAHVVFPAPTDPMTAFRSVITRSPGCKEQEVNGGIRIVTDLAREPVHTFGYDPTQTVVRSNIAKGGFSGSPRDPESVFNFYIFTYRDLLDPKYKERTIVVDYPELRDAAGGTLNQLGPIDLGGVMTGSLAQRIAKCTARLFSEQPFDRTFEVTGQLDSAHVAKNDYVWLAHKIIGNTLLSKKLARVSRESFEPRLGERKFSAQLWAADYYRDSDHGPLEN
jgi:hypothetical protein